VSVFAFVYFKSPGNAARVNVSSSWTRWKKHFLWRWYCGEKKNRMWLSVVRTLINNYMRHHSGQNLLFTHLAAPREFTARRRKYHWMWCFHFGPKTHQTVFRPHNAGEIWKRNSNWSFWITSDRKIIWLSWRHCFRKAMFSKCFPFTLSRHIIFKLLRLDERFRKAPFLWRISVDDRPNRRNKTAFSNSSGVWWGYEERGLKWLRGQNNRFCLHYTTLHTAGAPEIWIDQSNFSRREKLYYPDVRCKLSGNPLKSGNFSHWRRH